MNQPDFEKIAHAIKWSIPDDKVDTEFIVEQLRLVWNARGAADVAKIAESGRLYCASCGETIPDGTSLYVCKGSTELQHQVSDGTASCGPVLFADVGALRSLDR